jgi:hypothetical protein
MSERGMTPWRLRLGIQVLCDSHTAHAEQAHDGQNRVELRIVLASNAFCAERFT